MPIRIGLKPPVTGMVGIYGVEISWTARIADEVNAQGGVLGRPIGLIIEDVESLPQTVVNDAIENR